MSKVVIKGDASGTGTLTIAAPNTNSDVTFNLPTSGGTVMTTATSLDASQIPDGSITTAKLSATGTPSSSTFLSGDGSWQSAGGSLQTVLYTSSTTWTAPAGCTKVTVYIAGGGGGGGGCNASRFGGEGGFGGYAAGSYSVVPGTTYTITVGAGGTGNNGTGGGTAGGESWFGINSSSKLVSATGGGGGARTTTSSPAADGANGTSTGGTLKTGVHVGIGDPVGLGVFAGLLTTRENAGSATAAVVYSTSTTRSPGARGSGETSVYSESYIEQNNATGGVGGAVILEYVG